VSEGGELGALGERRFRLRHDVTVLTRDEGVVVVGPTASLELRSRSIGEAIGWLWPRLDGTRALDSLTAELPPGTRGAMAGLVARLHQRGMLLDLAEEDPARLAALDKLYPDQLSFLAHRTGAPLAAFDRFRRARFRVRGEGAVLRNVAAALADYGAVHARFAAPASDPALLRLLEGANNHDRERRFAIGHPSLPPGEEDEADVLIDADTDLSDAALAALCRDGPAATRMAGIYRLGERLAALLGPSEAGETPCFRSFAATAALQRADGPVAPAAAAIAAHHCVAALFADLCGIAPPAAPSVLEIDQQRLTSRLRRLAPDPACERHGLTAVRTALPAEAIVAAESSFPRPDVPDSAAATIEAYDSIHRFSAALTAPVGSVVFDIGEDQLVQVPFAQSAVSWRLPPSGGGSAEQILCAALSAREARNQAVLVASERWAAATLGAGSTGASAIGAGWSLPEAALRALAALVSRADCAEGSPVDLAELERYGPSGAHLLEMAAIAGPDGADAMLTAMAPKVGGWLAWRAGEPAAVPAFGATAGQALGNSLFRSLVEQSGGTRAHAAMLACGASAEDVRRLLLSASRYFDFAEITGSALAHEVPGAGVRLVEATRRPS
jgi:hypothetical protein